MIDNLDRPTVRRPGSNRRRVWWAVGLSALLITGINAAGYLTPCPDVCYSRVRHLFTFDPPPVREGQRSALRRLAFMIARCPNASRYSVEWDEPGRSNFLGVREHVTVYNRKTGNLQDSMFLRLSGVRESDIKAVASRSGDFDDIRHRLMPRQEVADETLERQLQQATGEGDAARAGRLLSQGADANYLPDETKYAIPDDVYVSSNYLDKGSPLRIAAGHSDMPMIRLLLEHGADVKKAERTEGSLLVRKSSVEVAGLLVEHGADVNGPVSKPDAWGSTPITPLMSAAFDGDLEMVRFLLAHGADATMKGTEGKTALDLAREELARKSTDTGAGLRETIHILEQARQ